ncbi:MAG: tRNA (adenosine(37)-N6)-threonylcarbamoyltransferase complex dimerization subunit type 1 TsaB [bacterium]
MYSIAIDTSCHKSTLAVLSENNLLISVEHNSQKLQTGFFSLIENTFRVNNIQPNEIERVLVGIGPGSFTGVRIGVSFAKTFCQLTNAELIPIRSYYLGVQKFQTGMSYLAVMPSTQSECYAVLYTVEKDNRIVVINDVNDGIPERIIDWLGANSNVNRVSIYGEGIGMLDGLKVPANLDITLSEKDESLPKAERAFKFLEEFPEVCRSENPLALKPLYVRPSPAETQRNIRNGIS